jgi:hypothetical protein
MIQWRNGADTMAREQPADYSNLISTIRRLAHEVDYSTTRQSTKLRWLRSFAARPIYQNNSEQNACWVSGVHLPGVVLEDQREHH